MSELIELLQIGPEIKLLIYAGGTKTEIKTDIEQGRITISLDDIIVLEYRCVESNKELETQIPEQLEAHRKYFEDLRIQAGKDEEDLESEFSRESELERNLGLIPESAARSTINIMKQLINARALLNGKTMKKEIEEKIEEKQKEHYGYQVIEGIIIGAGAYLDKLEQETLPAEIRPQLNEIIKIRKDILRTYSRLSSNCNKRIELIKRMYNLFYPEKEEKK